MSLQRDRSVYSLVALIQNTWSYASRKWYTYSKANAVLPTPPSPYNATRCPNFPELCNVVRSSWSCPVRSDSSRWFYFVSSSFTSFRTVSSSTRPEICPATLLKLPSSFDPNLTISKWFPLSGEFFSLPIIAKLRGTIIYIGLEEIMMEDTPTPGIPLRS